jgi:transposase-like protein/Zn ribbon nucleic-acid-binding protein
MFNQERACVAHMIEAKYPNGFVCPNCGSDKAYWIEDRNAFECVKCWAWSYLTQGTVMEKSKTPIYTWFLGAYLMTTLTPGISGVQFQRQAGIKRYETAFQLLHKLRAAMVDSERRMLSGVIEADETFIGGEKEGVGGRGALGKALVAGAVEVLSPKNGKPVAGRVRLQQVLDASEESWIDDFIVNNVKKHATIRTDGWSGYKPLKRNGYKHVVIAGETSKAVAKELVHIHRVFSNLKSWLIGTHHGVSPKHLQAYLNEYTFRYNRRGNPWLSFNTILGLASDADAPTYESLYAVGEEGGWVHPGGQDALV